MSVGGLAVLVKDEIAELFTFRDLRFTCLLRQERSDYPPLVLIFDSCKEFLAQRLDCFRPVERKSLIHHTARKMTGLATCLQNWLDVRCEVYLCWTIRPAIVTSRRKEIDGG